ncbi:trypsin-like peptidase domain-containing protein [Streptomyces sp. E11-3]|uniref:VMAP-C domain-containing protein n=1 Tax=Streptomyces sp. E11-3 TaxID=3110112 RepID=UPI00397ED75F
MTSSSWHARISCGGELGAGFLVTERHVLTCAHVVARSPAHPVTVTFAHGTGQLGELPAAVVAHGGWDGRETDPGDLAVLELSRPVPVTPAEFAPLTDAYGDPPRRLLTYGFPQHYDEGSLAEYRATADQLIAGEWVQLEAWSGHGQPLAPGFSGAAVVLADSGQVVGMVTAVAGDPRVRTGRMLPAQVMARYWPRICELIPTPAYGRQDKAELRGLVEAAGARGVRHAGCSPDQLYREAVGELGPPLPPQRFGTLWDAAWHLLSEVPDTGSVPRFAARLADFTEDAGVRRALRCWPRGRRTHEPDVCGRPTKAARRWSPILVEIAHSGAGRNQFLVEVSAYRAGGRSLVGSRTLPKSRVREYALKRIDEAFGELEPGASELIAFVLPREWLNQPVHQWKRSKDDPTPLGCFSPVVVLDLDRRRSNPLQHKIHQKWTELDGRPSAALHRIECGSTEPPGPLTVRLRTSTDLVGFAAPPKPARVRGLFAASLNGPAPVMLWPRAGCQGDHAPDGRDTGCSGSAFLDALAEYLAKLPPGDIPYHVLKLRERAYMSAEPEQHWAHELALLWEDPRCFPTTTGPTHSPVG